jgi:phosphoadenosine phosphosulfate reductase
MTLDQHIAHASSLENIDDVFVYLDQQVNEKIVFSTSFGIEDQVITQKIAQLNCQNIEFFTLDTGRMFAETYALWEKTQNHYKVKIKGFNPDQKAVEEFVEINGINAFYDSPELRKSCCGIRKVQGLKRALTDAKIWITGLRAEQSENRQNTNVFEWDDNFKLYKFNPLIKWSFEEVKDYVRKQYIPYNPLHDKGFVSIGCAPCTRAIKEGEDFRAGRWWWEDRSKKECGLHK